MITATAPAERFVTPVPHAIRLPPTPRQARHRADYQDDETIDSSSRSTSSIAATTGADQLRSTDHGQDAARTGCGYDASRIIQMRLPDHDFEHRFCAGVLKASTGPSVSRAGRRRAADGGCISTSARARLRRTVRPDFARRTSRPSDTWSSPTQPHPRGHEHMRPGGRGRRIGSSSWRAQARGRQGRAFAPLQSFNGHS